MCVLEKLPSAADDDDNDDGNDDDDNKNDSDSDSANAIANKNKKKKNKNKNKIKLKLKNNSDEGGGGRRNVRRCVLRERLAFKKKVEGEHLDIYGRLRQEMGMKTYLHRPMDYQVRENAETAFRVGDLDLPERRGIPVVGRRRKKMRRCAFVAK